MYCINPYDDEPIFLLDRQIGKDDENPEVPYISGTDFARELLYMDGEGKKKIWIYINCPGGIVKEGEDIMGAMLLTKTKVYTLVTGEAASMAGVLSQYGYKRYMLRSSRLMFHCAYSADGTQSKSLDVTNDAITKMISERSWKDEAAVRRMMEKTSYITAQEALDADLCDEIIENSELNAPKETDSKSRAQYAVKVLNQAKPADKSDTMKNIALALGLPETATEAEINAKAKLLNMEVKNGILVAKAKKKDPEDDDDDDDDDKVKKAKKAAKKAQDELDSLKAEMETEKVARAKEMSDAAAAKVDADKKATAKAKIVDTIKERGCVLTDKQVSSFVDLAGADDAKLASVIETINEIPVTKQAPKTIVLNKDDKNPSFKVQGKDKSGMDVIVDTEAMAAHMNAEVRKKAIARFNPNN